MLKRLHIEHFAIIDCLDIDFAPGLNIITGETGAGKSILMGALQLILGERADASQLRGEKKCLVEGVFSMAALPELALFFEQNDLDAGDELILRREIGSNGKSRSFINDTPVQLQQLRQLADFLVDLHQQFDTAQIAIKDFQISILDALAGNAAEMQQFTKFYGAYQSGLNLLEQRKSEQARMEKELDYHRFLLEEFQELALKESEIELLEEESKILGHAGEIQQELSKMHHALQMADGAVLHRLQTVLQKADQVAALYPKMEELAGRIKSCLIELKDIDQELESMMDAVETNEERMAWVNERLSKAYRLLKKHGRQNTGQLLELADELSRAIAGVDGLKSDNALLEQEVIQHQQAALGLAKNISKKRGAVINNFTLQVNKLLHRVGMPHAQIQVQMQPADLNGNGIDDISFLFQANLSKKGENQFLPLGKVASGGELSRLMLCIKSLVARSIQLPTLIFDEIDTGISGEAAKQVGLIMKELADAHQIISITHQPQIAAMADEHFYVHKETEKERIVTRVRKLDKSARVEAIARMLGGETPSAAAIANAKEMVGG